jgi:hypothetical protein
MSLIAASFKAGQLDYPLKDCFILDSRTTIHITNNKERIQNLHPPANNDYLWAGNS